MLHRYVYIICNSFIKKPWLYHFLIFKLSKYLQVLRKAIFHVLNAYKIPNVRVVGYSCKTNIPSNTAFRGFGAPQGMLCAETIIRHVSDFLQKDPIEVGVV